MKVSHHATGGRCPASPSQRGAALVEAAFVLPLFFMFVLGFIDLGMGVFQTSQASSAAADGARRGIVSLGTGESLTVSDQGSIRSEVRERLAGQQVDSIAITCLSETGAVASCTTARLIRVTASWQFRPVSFVGAALPVQQIRGTAKMAIVRQPAASSTTPPP